MLFSKKHLSWLHLLILVPFVIGVTVIAGWYLQDKTLIQIRPEFPAMVYNTALGFVLLSLGIFSMNTRYVAFRKSVSLVAILMGLLTLVQFLTDINVGIDWLFHKPFYDVDVKAPGRMAASTATCLVLLGLCVFFYSQRFWIQLLTTTFSTLVFGFAAVGFLGFVLKINTEYGWGSLSRMAVHTAVGFLFSGAGLLLLNFREIYRTHQRRRVLVPFYVISYGVLISTLIWELMVIRDIERNRGEFLIRAESIRTALDNSFFPLAKALDHMAIRFAAGRYPTVASWQLDAGNYFQDFAGLRQLIWRPYDERSSWVYPGSVESKNGAEHLLVESTYTETLERVRDQGQPLMTTRVGMSSGESGVILVVPIKQGTQVLGSLSAVITTSSFLHPVVRPDGYHFAIFDSGKLLLNSGAVDSIFARDWVVRTHYNSFGVRWLVELAPSLDVVRKNTSILPTIVLLFGVSVSVLLGLMTRLYARARESELRVQEALEWQRASVNAIPMIFISVDVLGRIRDMNRGAQVLLEYDLHDLIERGTTPELFLDPRELRERAAQLKVELGREVTPGFECLVTLLETSEAAASEWTLISRTGKRYSAVLSFSPIHAPMLHHTGYLLVFEDVTQKKERERKIYEQEAKILTSSRLASLGEMASGIAHEINNPLTIINGHIGMMRKTISHVDVKNQDELNKRVEAVEKTVQRIAKIVRGLRSYARESDPGTEETYALGAIVEDTLAFCEDKFKNDGVLLIQRVESDLVLSGHPIQISQVLLNLLNNAHDAVLGRPEKEVVIEAVRKDQGVELSVTDSGPGVPIQLRQKIMEPFFTTKEVGKGIGLGLSISSGIVQSHGGRFYIDESSERTRFVVWLPFKST